LHKVRAKQSQEFNSKILAWPGAEGDREEGNEDESSQSRSAIKQIEKCWVIFKRKQTNFFYENVVANRTLLTYYSIFYIYKTSVYFLNIVL
jgi:hypothetical protein